MRDKRFIAVHRGGPLSKEQHYQLISWAHTCTEHVLPLFGDIPSGIIELVLSARKKRKEE